jgi:N-methylhydantoinase A
MRVATDVGGTFTDLVYYDYDEATGQVGEIRTRKSDTTPPNFEEGVMNTIDQAGITPAHFSFFAHGTTVVINALTEHKGSKTGLITTKGFRDVLEIQRGNRPDVFNFYFTKPTPFVPRHLRREITERSNFKGDIETPLALDELAGIVEDFRAEGVEAVAICFLHSYANPANEIAVLEELKRLNPELSAVASHQITREWREYERTSTAVLSAYIHPITNAYLDSLERRLDEGGFSGNGFVMQSSGGIAGMAAARRNPIAMVESGPASGVLGAVALGQLIGEPNIIALDIGGTTAKCSLVENTQVRLTTDYRINWSRTNAGYPIKTPVVDIIEIGNGGGSIAWIDEGGKLHVGPESAGALPGPAAYGRGGTEPTTTDAHFITRRIDEDYFLGGEITPDMENVRQAFASLAKRLEVSIDEAARGIIRIANANMVNALKLVSVNKGYDPRDFTLVAYGGGGSMHAVALARDLNMAKVVIPVNPAVFSAWGMLMTDLRRDYLRTNLMLLDESATSEISSLFDSIESDARDDFQAEDIEADSLILQRQADMRYIGQDHVVKVDFPDGTITEETIGEAVERFHSTHEKEFTFRMEHPVELVTFHLVAFGRVPKPELAEISSTGRPLNDTVRGNRLVDFDTDGIHETPIHERALLEPGMVLQGPLIIEEPATTILIPPGAYGEVDNYGNIHIHLEKQD